MIYLSHTRVYNSTCLLSRLTLPTCRHGSYSRLAYTDHTLDTPTQLTLYTIHTLKTLTRLTLDSPTRPTISTRLYGSHSRLAYTAHTLDCPHGYHDRPAYTAITTCLHGTHSRLVNTAITLESARLAYMRTLSTHPKKQILHHQYL